MNNTYTLIILSSLCFVAAFILTGYIRRYAIASNLMDTPNARSAHFLPVPRGGGLSFVICFLSACLLLAFFKQISLNAMLLYTVPSSMVAVIGLIDDRRSLPSLYRLAAHFALAALVVLWINPAKLLPPVSISSLLFFSIVCIFYLAGCLNCFNFMDGINGLAAFQAIFIGLSAAGLFYLYQDESTALLLILLAVSICGFLLWNFPNAKIFMGDVGSGFLGFVLGLFSLQALLLNYTLFTAWLILSALFYTDTALTLLARAIHRQPLFKAHNTHAYQKMTQKIGKHWPVTLAAALTNCLWLLPLAYYVATGQLNIVYGLLAAYLPLVSIVLLLKAGR